MLSHNPLPNADRVQVTFTIPSAIWADTIHLVGDFNDWDQQSHPLVQTEDHWIITLELEREREYRYRYLFNGTDWCTDSNADRYVPNDFGGYDSVLVT